MNLIRLLLFSLPWPSFAYSVGLEKVKVFKYQLYVFQGQGQVCSLRENLLSLTEIALSQSRKIKNYKNFNEFLPDPSHALYVVSLWKGFWVCPILFILLSDKDISRVFQSRLFKIFDSLIFTNNPISRSRFPSARTLQKRAVVFAKRTRYMNWRF